MPDRSISEAQDEILAIKIAELLSLGYSGNKVRNALSMSNNEYYRLMRQRPEILKEIREQVRIEALSETRRSLERLGEIREQSENLNASVRATVELLTLAGMTPDGQDKPICQIFNIDVGAMKGSGLRDLALEMAKKLELDEKIIDAEFSLRPGAGETSGSVESGDPAGTPQADSAQPRPQEDQPA